MPAIFLALRIDPADLPGLERAILHHAAFHERRRPVAFKESWCDTPRYALAAQGVYLEGDPEALVDRLRQRLGKQAKKAEVRIRVSGRRTLFLMGGTRWAAELALDRGLAEAGRRHRDVARLRVTVTKGSWAAGMKLVRGLLASVPAHLEFQAGAHLIDWARGLSSGGARKASEIALDRQATLGQAFQSILASVLDHLAVNAERLSARDTVE
ncbi:MAG: hypothetical protein IT565_07855, partial [Rhodospirillales bacterium]|nr:hypothetical protein [Rhodospirillales bacterium]